MIFAALNTLTKEESQVRVKYLIKRLGRALTLIEYEIIKTHKFYLRKEEAYYSTGNIGIRFHYVIVPVLEKV
jgi:hypothetical protein